MNDDEAKARAYFGTGQTPKEENVVTCTHCGSVDPNIVGVKSGKECRDPFHCPSPETHGNPFRYCPYCTWAEEIQIKQLESKPVAEAVLTGWWRVILPDGTVWMETSDSQEAQFGLIGDDGERHGHPDGARIQRLWQKTDSEWRDLT